MRDMAAELTDEGHADYSETMLAKTAEADKPWLRWTSNSAQQRAGTTHSWSRRCWPSLSTLRATFITLSLANGRGSTHLKVGRFSKSEMRRARRPLGRIWV